MSGQHVKLLVVGLPSPVQNVFGMWKPWKTSSRSPILNISWWSRSIVKILDLDFHRFCLQINKTLNKTNLHFVSKSWNSRSRIFKFGRDHRDIFEIGLRDLVFRVFQLPKTFPTCFEVRTISIFIWGPVLKKNCHTIKQYRRISDRCSAGGPF